MVSSPESLPRPALFRQCDKLLPAQKPLSYYAFADSLLELGRHPGKLTQTYE